MTPGEFQYLMASSVSFYPSNCIGFFPSKKGTPIRVNTNWQYRRKHYSEKVTIEIYKQKYDNILMVKISDAGNKSESYQLKSLTIPNFIDHLNRFIFSDDFKIWSKKMKRNYLLKDLI